MHLLLLQTFKLTFPHTKEQIFGNQKTHKHPQLWLSSVQNAEIKDKDWTAGGPLPVPGRDPLRGAWSGASSRVIERITVSQTNWVPLMSSSPSSWAGYPPPSAPDPDPWGTSVEQEDERCHAQIAGEPSFLHILWPGNIPYLGVYIFGTIHPWKCPQLHYPWCYWWLQSLPEWDPKRDCSCPAGDHLEAAGTCTESCLHREETTERREISEARFTLNNPACVILTCFLQHCRQQHGDKLWLTHQQPETVWMNSVYQQECCSAHSPTLGRCWCPTARRTEDPEKRSTNRQEFDPHQ